MMPKQSKKTRAAVPVRKVEKTSSEAEWVTSMREHYHQTGAYRTSDLDRVLGDPRKQISGEAPEEFVGACRMTEK
jgi:hypothetical protein